MGFPLNLVIGLTLLFVATIIEGNKECIDSISTAKRVNSCPKNEIEWKEAAAKKNCGSIKKHCSSFEYHCVINAWGNETIEVCAPGLKIVGGNCAEYNFGGSRIQLNEKVTCKECPTSYESTKSYQYQECYDYATTATRPISETTTQSVTNDKSTRISNKSLPLSINETNLNCSSQRQHDNDSSINNNLMIIVICAAVGVVVLIVFLIKTRSYWTKRVFLQLKRFCIGNQSNGTTGETKDISDTPAEETLIPKKSDTAFKTNSIRSTELLDQDCIV